jgi:hypothetical protein
MMTKRRAAWVGFAAVGLLPGVLALGALLQDRVTEESCNRVTNGMTLEEVEAIFGRPADHTLTEPRAKGLHEHAMKHGFKTPCTSRAWAGPHYTACTIFDADGRVVSHATVQNDSPPWYHRLADLLGL